MNYYVVYDKISGKILQTHANYAMETDDPIEIETAKFLNDVKKDFSNEYDLAIKKVPRDFDPRKRTHRLKLEAKTGKLIAEPIKRKNRKK